MDSYENCNWRENCGVVANVQNCFMAVSKFELQSSYHVHLRTNNLRGKHEPLIPSAMG